MEKRLKLIYSGIHFFYYTYYALIGGFASAFLLAKGYTSSAIGLFIALASILSVLLQPVLADLADRSKKIIEIALVTSLALLILTIPLLFLEKGIVLTIVYILDYAILTSLQPLVYALCYRLQDNGYPIVFATSRSVGSGMYGLTMTIFGSVIVALGYGVVPMAGIVSLAITILLVNSIRKQATYKETKVDTLEDVISFKEFIARNKNFLIFCLGTVLIFFGHYVGTFMLQIVNNIGGNEADMGIVVGICAFSEIPMLLLFEKIHSRISYKNILRISCFGFLLKIFLFMIAKNLTLMYFAAATQMFSFGLFLPAYVGFFNETMSKQEAVRGQATVGSAMTLCGVLSSAIGGVLIDGFGVNLFLQVSALISVIGAIIILLILKKM